MQNIKNFDDVVLKTNISGFVRSSDILKGKNYDKDKINMMEQKENLDFRGNVDYYHFQIDSESKNTYYDVSIVIRDKKTIVRTLCDCKQYRATNSCKHIAAAFYNYYPLLFDITNNDMESISNNILDRFMNSNKNIIKKELNISLTINIE